jgi:hypothetical protein
LPVHPQRRRCRRRARRGQAALQPAWSPGRRLPTGFGLQGAAGVATSRRRIHYGDVRAVPTATASASRSGSSARRVPFDGRVAEDVAAHRSLCGTKQAVPAGRRAGAGSLSARTPGHHQPHRVDGREWYAILPADGDQAPHVGKGCQRNSNPDPIGTAPRSHSARAQRSGVPGWRWRSAPSDDRRVGSLAVGAGGAHAVTAGGVAPLTSRVVLEEKQGTARRLALRGGVDTGHQPRVRAADGQQVETRRQLLVSKAVLEQFPSTFDTWLTRPTDDPTTPESRGHRERLPAGQIEDVLGVTSGRFAKWVSRGEARKVGRDRLRRRVHHRPMGTGHGQVTIAAARARHGATQPAITFQLFDTVS